jgi:methionyl-tRNA synthetase
MSKGNFYITTTLPYVNAPLHLGHAVEIVRADALARYKNIMGYNVFFNTGTDEHGQKIFESANKAGQTPKEYTDYYANLFQETVKKFGLINHNQNLKLNFIRTTDEQHIYATQKFWQNCANNGYIYKKNYKSKYCVGCEEEKTDSELIDGKCPVHSNRELEIIEEENYFFKFSEFGDRLLKYYDQNPNFIIPENRMNEMREFIKSGLRDFSISRLKSKMSWGIAVPNDSEHVMYVWFDALVNYVSCLGWPIDENNFKKFWGEGNPTQYCGKDNTRFQGVMWQAMLMAADLPPTKQIIVDGFILGEGGIKMSKTLGNIINPLDLIEEYGAEVLRYFILRDFHPFEDTPVSEKLLKQSYNANLANGLGNLISRVMKMASDNLEKIPIENFDVELPEKYRNFMETFHFKNACDFIWQEIAEADKIIQDEKPFILIKENPAKAQEILRQLVKKMYTIALMLEPIMPETSIKIKNTILENKKPENLFARKD